MKFAGLEFEWNEVKSAANKAKHGLDFQEARLLWCDVRRLDVPARTDGEMRFLSVGMIDGKHWAGIWTPRGGRIRIISVRRARPQEVEHYEQDYD